MRGPCDRLRCAFNGQRLLLSADNLRTRLHRELERPESIERRGGRKGEKGGRLGD